MSRQYTGRQIKRTAEVKQKNGDVYVYERVYQYDRDKKKTVVISNRLIGKRRAGQTELEPTKRREAQRSQTGELPDMAQAARATAAPEASEADLRTCVLERSRLLEAAELCLPDAMRTSLLDGAWQLMKSRMPDGGQYNEYDKLTRLVRGAHGLLPALLRLRLLQAEGAATLIALPGEPGRVFFVRDGALLGEQVLPELLSVSAGAERVWSQVAGGDLLLQRAYIDQRILGVEDLRLLERQTFDFVCPLSLRSETGQRLFTETALLRRQSQTLLPQKEDVWASTFPLRQQAETLEVTDGRDAEFFLHIYSFPAQKEKEAAQFNALLGRLLELMECGTSVGELSQRARDLLRRFLRENEKSEWIKEHEACRRHVEQLGCLMLIANGERDAGEALRLVHQADEWRGWQARIQSDGLDTDTEVLVRVLRDAVAALIDDARRTGPDPGSLEARTVSEAAGAYLENADPGEILSMLLGPEPETAGGRARRAAVWERLQQVCETKKATAGV